MELTFEQNKTPCLVRKELIFLGSLKCMECKHFGGANLVTHEVTCNHETLSLCKGIRNFFRKRRQVKDTRL